MSTVGQALLIAPPEERFAPIELFHAPDGQAFADLMFDGHRETWPIRSEEFRRTIENRSFERTGRMASSKDVKAAICFLEVRALQGAPERPVHIRVAGSNDRFYVDLGDSQWSAAEIGPEGWRIVQNPPVRFRRFLGMRPLPIPQTGGSLETLRSLINITDDESFVLVVAWLLDALRHRTQHPVLVLAGGEGTAKSTLVEMLQALIDPTIAPLAGLPRSERDLLAQAGTGYLLAYDNVSAIPTGISDAVCRISTSGARPLIINGMKDVVTQADLADRCLFVTCDSIPDERRCSKEKLWAEFENARAQIFGLLLDAFAHGLRMEPETMLDRLPRMADFALGAAARETAFWPRGTFWAAYGKNRAAAAEKLIETDSVASAVRSLMAGRTTWTGSATKLLISLGPIMETAGKASLPVSPRDLAVRLRRAAPSLGKVGIKVGFDRAGHNRDRVISIFAEPDVAGDEPETFCGSSVPSASSASSASSAPSASMGGTELEELTGNNLDLPTCPGPADDADDADTRNSDSPIKLGRHT